MERILIVGVNWLGDALMMTPVFRALKENIISSYVGVMTVERVKEVFEDNPYIDEIIVFDEKKHHRSLSNKWQFVNTLKKANFDSAFFIHRSFTRIFLCALAGIPERIGYGRLKSNFILR